MSDSRRHWQDKLAIVTLAAVQDDQLPDGHLRVLITMFTFAKRPSALDVALRCGYGTPTVARLMDDLEDMGWLREVVSNG